MNRAYTDLIDLSLNSVLKYEEVRQAKIDLAQQILEDGFEVTPPEAEVTIGFELKNNTETLFVQMDEKYEDIIRQNNELQP